MALAEVQKLAQWGVSTNSLLDACIHASLCRTSCRASWDSASDVADQRVEKNPKQRQSNGHRLQRGSLRHAASLAGNGIYEAILHGGVVGQCIAHVQSVSGRERVASGTAGGCAAGALRGGDDILETIDQARVRVATSDRENATDAYVPFLGISSFSRGFNALGDVLQSGGLLSEALEDGGQAGGRRRRDTDVVGSGDRDDRGGRDRCQEAERSHGDGEELHFFDVAN